jgi:hypothetical protein
MWPFDGLFGPGKKSKEEYSSECAKVLADKEVIERQVQEVMPVDKNDPSQRIRFYAKRLEVLNDQSLNVVARLAATKMFFWTVDDYVKKLQLASQGNKDAVAEVNDIRAKTPNLVADEIKRLSKKMGDWQEKERVMKEKAASEGAKLAGLKKQFWDDVHAETQRREIVLPRDKNDMSQWMTYYRERVARLENSAVSLPARMLWTNVENRDALMQEYIETVNRILLGKDTEEHLHQVEAQMQGVISMEARGVREKYPKFFVEAPVKEFPESESKAA